MYISYNETYEFISMNTKCWKIIGFCMCVYNARKQKFYYIILFSFKLHRITASKINIINHMYQFLQHQTDCAEWYKIMTEAFVLNH